MCHLCNTKPVYEFTNKRKLCKNCFIHWFEKKFLFINRKFAMIKRGDIIVIKGEGYRKAVLESILNKFKDKLMIQVNNKNANKIAVDDTIDAEANNIINILINDKISKLTELSPVNKNIIKPLYLFTDEEVLLYAKELSLKKRLRREKGNKGLKFNKLKESKNKIEKFLEDTEKKHPEVKRAVVNSYLKLYD